MAAWAGRVTIRWLKGVTQPSRLTCRAYLADITPAGSLPCSRCTQGMSWRHPATPLSCRGNQALAAGSETRRRSVDGVPRGFLGERLLKE